jgi:hypothetical protein
MEYAAGLGPVGGDTVGVRVPPPAQIRGSIAGALRLAGLALLPVVAVSLLAAGAAAPGAAATSAARAHWVIQRTPNRAAPGNQLNGVSCASAAACTAVGSWGPFLGAGRRNGARTPLVSGARTATLAERWDGRRWRIQPTADPGASAVLLGVSCSSARACTAVGDEQEGSALMPLAERWDGSRWSLQPTPGPASAIVSDLLGVSCPAADMCMAVGDYYGSSGPVLGFAERWDGSRWSIADVPQPVGATETYLSSVSCPAATTCTAVGSFVGTSASFPLAERWTAAGWRRQPAPGSGELLAVACPAVLRCAAVGDRPKARHGQSATLAMGWDRHGWTTQATPAPRGSTQGILQGLSCPSLTSCTAVGWAALSTDVTLAEHWNGTAWTVEPTPDPDGSQASFLSGVWCGAPAACRAAGSYVIPSGSKTLAEASELPR